jgi:hypothetical protein
MISKTTGENQNQLGTLNEVDVLTEAELSKVVGGTTLADVGRAVIAAVQFAEGKITTHATTLP